MTFKVVRGYKTETDRGGESCIYTLDGEKLFIRQTDIEREFENEVPKKGTPTLSTFFIKPNAVVKIEVSLEDDRSRQIGINTTYKYYDDNGCVSKTYDDQFGLGMQPGTITKRLDDGGTISKSRDDT